MLTHTERMARIDGCPNCVYNAEAPRRVRPCPNGFRADYHCHHCGHEWTTAWMDN